MNHATRKALFVIAATAITVIPSVAKAQYYNPYSAGGVNSNPYGQNSYPSYQERMRQSDRQHQQYIQSIWQY